MAKTDITSQRGAILIQVAIATLVLFGLMTFVVDYGILWVGRHHAQNSADAAALAGAVALAFDDFNDRTDTGPAKMSALNVALANDIVAQDPSVTMADITFPVCPNDGTNTCIRVDVFRNVARGNPLPVWFGQLVGLTQQNIRATATAQAAIADASDCLKPFGVPDKWLDVHDETVPVDNRTFTADDTYDKTVTQGKNKGQALPDPDVYIPPGTTGATGYTLANDLGRRVVLKAGNPQDSLAPGFFFPVRIPRADGDSTGGSDYAENIATCNGIPIPIGTTIQNEPGNMIGPTTHGMQDLIALDPNARWNPTERTVEGSCAQSATPCAPRSPRIVAIPVFDTEVYYQGKLNGLVTLKIVNILGFFVDRMQGNEVAGYFTSIPGVVTGGGNVSTEFSFMKTPMLVR